MYLKLLFFLVVTSVGLSQTKERVKIYGSIFAKENDVEGITIYNVTTQRGTITNEKGGFSIFVKVNDQIEVSAVQYKKTTILISNEVVQSKKITIRLEEQTNTLKEVVLSTTKLTGYLETDIKSIKIPDSNPLKGMSFGNISKYKIPNNHLTKVDNTFMKKGQLIMG